MSINLVFNQFQERHPELYMRQTLLLLTDKVNQVGQIFLSKIPKMATIILYYLTIFFLKDFEIFKKIKIIKNNYAKLSQKNYKKVINYQI